MVFFCQDKLSRQDIDLKHYFIRSHLLPLFGIFEEYIELLGIFPAKNSEEVK